MTLDEALIIVGWQPQAAETRPSADAWTRENAAGLADMPRDRLADLVEYLTAQHALIAAALDQARAELAQRTGARAPARLDDDEV